MVYRQDELFENADTLTVMHDPFAPVKEHKEHTHEFFEFVYIQKGEGTHWIDGVEYPVKRGCMLFINFGQTHAFRMQNAAFINILLRPEYIGLELAREAAAAADLFSFVLENGEGGQCVAFSGAEIEQIDALVRLLSEEFDARADNRREAMNDLFHLIILHLLRKIRGGRAKPADTAMTEVIDFLKAHYRENLSLSEVSERFFYNSSYFSRLFKKFTGKGLHAYLNALKIGEATRLLDDPALSLDEIAAKVGYGDIKTFYVQFKKLVGTTPGEFRNAGRGAAKK